MGKADGKLVKVTSGQTGIAAAEVKLEFDYQKDMRTTVIWCRGVLPDGSFSGADKTQGNLAPIATSPGIQNAVPNWPRYRSQIAPRPEFLVRFSGTIGVQSIPRNILKARRLVEDNLASDAINVSTIAAQASVTHQHLIASFRRHIGTRPSRYPWRTRANRARQLLIHARFGQSEIAHRCGYNSLPHYSRSIKSLFGMTPAPLRRDMGFTQPSNASQSGRDLIF